jgi:hypothetical protein
MMQLNKLKTKIMGSSEFADPVRFCEGGKPMISFIQVRYGNRDLFLCCSTSRVL